MALSIKKRVVLLAALAGFALLASAAWYTWQLIPIGSAYKAKVLCSGIFISKRAPQEILRQDLDGPAAIMSEHVDFRKKTVIVSFPGTLDQQAVYREGLGCTLLAGADASKILNDVFVGAGSGQVVRDRKRHAAVSGKQDREPAPGVPTAHLARIMDQAFAKEKGVYGGRTRAIVIRHGNRMIAERYVPGITADTALPGWSMSKSVVNALVGILVGQGRLSVDQPVPVAAWSGEGDRRKSITVDHLLRMISGLEFDERSGPFLSDVNHMLLMSSDAAAYALNKPLIHEPGTHWHYSSGSTNIISRIIRSAMESGDDYHAFPRNALFDRVGMASALMEVDASGTFVGSSFLYASARDWARFGLLYLQDGVWEGQRILPEGWVSYSARPTPASPRGRYGAHFWTNGGTASSGAGRPYPRLPEDAFYASGYEGQYVVIIPSRRLVVVRLGRDSILDRWNMESFVADVIEAMESTPTVTG